MLGPPRLLTVIQLVELNVVPPMEEAKSQSVVALAAPSLAEKGLPLVSPATKMQPLAESVGLERLRPPFFCTPSPLLTLMAEKTTLA